MQNSKKVIKKTLFATTIVAGALLGSAAINQAEAFSFSDLGSGADVRAELLDNTNNGIVGFDLKCGEGKTKDAKCGEGKCGGDKKGKSKDAKCGEGKCGDKKGKSKDAKCGEGKCGDHGKKSKK
ncbi:MAG: hypothetical protein R2800_06850 [Flavipsychrobacter sp.]